MTVSSEINYLSSLGMNSMKVIIIHMAGKLVPGGGLNIYTDRDQRSIVGF